jgi:hypothetical protein
MPAPSLENVRLTDATTVALTATVPVAEVALIGVDVRAMATAAAPSVRSLFALHIMTSLPISARAPLGC